MSSSNGSSDNDAGTSGTTTSSLTDRINEDITMCNRMQEHPTDNSVPRSENVIAENFSGGVDGSSESGVTPSPSGEVGDVVAPERSSSNSSSPLFFTDDDNSSADDTISTIRSTRDLDDDDDDEDDDDEDDNDDDEEDGSNENEDYGHGERVPQAEDAWLRDLTHSPRLSNSQSSSDSSLDRASMKCFIPYKEESKPKPRHKWFVVPEVMKRELGTSSRLHASELFQKRCYGSLHVVQRLELMYKLEAHKGCVNALNFNPSGTILTSASDDRKVMLWDWALGKCMLQYESGHTSNVLQARFLGLSGDRHIVSSARDGQVRLAVLSGTGVCKSTRQLFRHKRPVSRLATLSDTPHVFHSAGEDGLVTTIDVRESRAKKFLVVRDEVVGRIPLFCIDNNPMNCHEFCVAGDDKYIRLYDKRMIAGNKVPLKKFCPNHLVGRYVAVNVTCAIFNYNGKEILGSYNDEDIYLFDTELSDGSDYVHRYRGHRNHVTVKGVNFFGPKSQFIVSGSDCGHIYFWEKNTESIVQWMAGDEEGIVNVLEPHPHVPVLATCGLDHDIKIWVPSCEQEPFLDGLKTIVRFNHKLRRDMRESTDPWDLQLQGLWMHINRYEWDGSRLLGDNPISLRNLDVLERARSSSSSSSGDDVVGRPQCPTS